MQNKAFSKIGILIILILLIGGGYFSWQYLSEQKEETKAPEQATEDETADWNTYQNTRHGYEIKYPLELKILREEFDRQGISIETVPMISWGFPRESEDIERDFNIIIDVQDTMGKSLNSLVEQGCIKENQKEDFIRINCPDKEGGLWMVNSVFAKNNLFYNVSIIMFSIVPISDLSFPQEELNIYNQLLYTFRFLD